eukprot:6086112-Pyramimonas_sp.AAC.1
MVRVIGIARRLTVRPRPGVVVFLACPFAGEMRVATLAGERGRRAGRATTHSPTLCRLVNGRSSLLFHQCRAMPRRRITPVSPAVSLRPRRPITRKLRRR